MIFITGYSGHSVDAAAAVPEVGAADLDVVPGPGRPMLRAVEVDKITPRVVAIEVDNAARFSSLL